MEILFKVLLKILFKNRILHVHVNSTAFPGWVGCGGGGGAGAGGLWSGGFIFVFWSRRGMMQKKICMMWADMKKKNAPFKISSALPNFSKHNKCSLSNQTNSFTTQREDKC